MSPWSLVPILVLVLPPFARFEGETSSRTREVLRYDCWSDLGRREVTLFANGTVRVREGLQGREGVTLGELEPPELDAFLARLRDIDLAETDAGHRTVLGEWVERCILELDLAGRKERSFAFGRYDTLSLGVRRLIRIAEDMSTHVDPRTSGKQLPSGYEPRQGDLLRRRDGALFEVISYTADGRGLELRGIDQPLTIYVSTEDLRLVFEAVEQRRGW